MRILIFFPALFIITITVKAQITTAENGLNSPTATSVRLGGALLQNTNIDLGTSYNFNFLKDAATNLSILNNGNIGIGIANPATRLHIVSPGGTTFRITSGPYNSELKQNTYNTEFEAASNFTLNWGSTSNRNTMVLQNTTAGIPGGKFFLSNGYGAFVNGFNGFKVGASEKFGFYTHGNTVSYYAIGAISTNNDNWGMAFYTKNGGTDLQAAQFSKSGNLLIGTTTDAGNKLQVNGTISATALKIATGAGAGKVLISDASGNATWQDAPASTNSWSVGGNGVTAASKLGNTSANDLSIITSDIARVYVKANGNVGIGTVNINDSYKLSVDGNIRTRKVRVDQATWPDYVFETGYPLRSLQEVEQFIQEQKHLPDLPAAAEVKKEGVDLGDNQAVLLKKIEELTLYVIQLQKQVTAQQQRIDTLENR